MTVKDFNRHKSNGGMAQLTTIDAIKSFKCGKKWAVEMAAQMEQAVCTEVALIKCVVNVVRHMHTRIAQHLAKSAINVVTKIILVHVAGQI